MIRPVCNMCNAPKPKAVLTQEEIRTGAGGGFNERQERAAATSIEVADDGYDDFGRRAKEKKASDKKAKEVPTSFTSTVFHFTMQLAALARLHGSFGITSSEDVSIVNAAALVSSSLEKLGAGGHRGGPEGLLAKVDKAGLEDRAHRPRSRSRERDQLEDRRKLRDQSDSRREGRDSSRRSARDSFRRDSCRQAPREDSRQFHSRGSHGR